ncbi:MAG: paraquat-inducible protein A [Deltaproteobacteria bacterium]|nr:paraquat-inducible protein A [Deltaproteobacteria bacterium]
MNSASRSVSTSLAFTLTALIFYIPANTFPFMTMELYGSRTSATIWSGVVALADSGAWLIAAVIFLASIVIPLIKLFVLLYLSLTAHQPANTRLKLQLLHAVEIIGRWSMLDIFLLAVLVAIMKLWPWTSVQPEIGSWMFALVVIFTMLASGSFDSKILTEKKHE